MFTKYKFWLKSSRGTNVEKHTILSSDLTEEEIKEELERWCETIPAWNISDNYMRYGYDTR